MLRFTNKNKNHLVYKIEGSLSEADLREYYATINTHFQAFGKLHLEVTAQCFSGYDGLKALSAFLRQEPGLLRKVASYTITTEQAWLRKIVRTGGWLLPGILVQVRPSAVP